MLSEWWFWNLAKIIISNVFWVAHTRKQWHNSKKDNGKVSENQVVVKRQRLSYYLTCCALWMESMEYRIHFLPTNKKHEKHFSYRWFMNILFILKRILCFSVLSKKKKDILSFFFFVNLKFREKLISFVLLFCIYIKKKYDRCGAQLLFVPFLPCNYFDRIFGSINRAWMDQKTAR